MRIVRTVEACRVQNARPAELEWLSDFLSVPALDFVGGQPRPTVKRYYHAGRKTFPPGLLRTVQREAASEGFVVDVVDERVRPEGRFEVPESFLTKVPHYYQTEAAKRAYAAETSVVEIGTGGGKSFVASICFASVPWRCIYVVSTSLLAEQAAAEFELETGESAGRFFDGHAEIGARCVFATFGSLYANMMVIKKGVRLLDGQVVQEAGLDPKDRKRSRPVYSRQDKWIADNLSGFGWLVVDECHEVPAATFEDVALSIPAFFRTGLSASPFSRGDGKAMSVTATTGTLCYRKTQRQLADEGFTAMGTYRMVRFRQEVFVGKWQDAYTYQVVRDPDRNALVSTIAAIARKPCLVLFNEIEHGGILLRALQARGLKVERVDGRDATNKRRDLAGRLNRKEIDVLVSSKILRTGANMPAIRSMVMAGGRKDEVSSIQGPGRATRLDKASGKTTYDVWAVLDTAADGRKGKGRWVANHAHKRLFHFRRQGFDVLVADDPRGPWETLPALPPDAQEEEA